MYTKLKEAHYTSCLIIICFLSHLCLNTAVVKSHNAFRGKFIIKLQNITAIQKQLDNVTLLGAHSHLIRIYHPFLNLSPDLKPRSSQEVEESLSYLFHVLVLGMKYKDYL